MALGTTERRAPTVSANVLGDVEERQPATLVGEESVLSTPRSHLHWYGKHDVYELRKMGHVTLVGGEDGDAESDTDDLLWGSSSTARRADVPAVAATAGSVRPAAEPNPILSTFDRPHLRRRHAETQT